MIFLWLITFASMTLAAMSWKKANDYKKLLSCSKLINKTQAHQIKNDLTAVHVAAEGLLLTTKQTLSADQYAVAHSAVEYATRLKRSVCEVLDLSLINNHELQVFPAECSLDEFLKCKEFVPFKDSLQYMISNNYNRKAVFNADRRRFMQLMESFVALVNEFGANIRFDVEENKDSIESVTFGAYFELKKTSEDIFDTVSFKLVTQMAKNLGLLTAYEPSASGQYRWAIMIPSIEWKQQQNKILVVSSVDTETISSVSRSFGAIVKSVKGVEEALQAIKEQSYSAVIFDGSKDLGHHLALAKVLKYDLHIPSKTVLVAPSNTVNLDVAAEFGIDSVLNDEQYRSIPAGALAVQSRFE